MIRSRVEAVKRHAAANYNLGGWDVIIETYTDEEIWDFIKDCPTDEASIQKFIPLVQVWRERYSENGF